MVPTVRLELTRLSPPPPQDGVSTNSTTSATAGILPAFRKAALLRSGLRLLRNIGRAVGRRGIGRGGRRRRGRVLGCGGGRNLGRGTGRRGSRGRRVLAHR